MTAFSNNPEKQPIFGKYGAGFLGSGPGRADQRRGKLGHAISHKIRKRQKIERDYAIVSRKRHASDSESDSEEPRPRARDNHAKEEKSQHWFASLMSGIESRPHLPHVLSYYAQLTLNFFLLGMTVFGIYVFWTTIKSDVDKASEEAKAEFVAEIHQCGKDYISNGCGTGRRAPALEIICNNWERCMSRDPDLVGRARISAHTFAQILNSFIEPISYKAMVKPPRFLSRTQLTYTLRSLWSSL